MSKIEKRFERDILKPADIALWIRGPEPLRVHSMMKGFWQVDVKPPYIVPVEEQSAFNFTDNTISLGSKDPIIYANRLNKIGIKQSLNDILMPNLGEEDTHYISYSLVPENFKREYKLQQMHARSNSYTDFINAATIGAQLEAIGYLGRKETARRIGIANHEEIENELLPETAQDKEKAIGVLIESGTIEQVGMMVQRGVGGAEELNQLRKIITGIARDTVTGAGQYSVSKRFEEDYRSRFPKLIRKVLEPDKQTRNEYLGFLEKYHPVFSIFIKAMMSP